MTQSTTALISQVTQRLVERLKPEKIILFGSHAWGSPGQDSDIDIYVIVADSDLSPSARATEAHRALRGVPAPVDVMVKTRAESERFRRVPASLDKEIWERGRVLYG